MDRIYRYHKLCGIGLSANPIVNQLPGNILSELVFRYIRKNNNGTTIDEFVVGGKDKKEDNGASDNSKLT